jgi:diguanylate cyclase (GGDEF)-like protein
MAAGAAATGLLGLFDLKTGVEVPLSMFYLIPVFAVSWLAGARPGFFICVCASLSYFATHHPRWELERALLLLTADSAARLVFYSVVTLLTANLRLYLERQVHMARTDPLTGAANARAFYEQAELELARARRFRRPVSLVYFDIDDFKEVNDSYGHQIGDLVLVEAARAARSVIREVDLLARLGGDEFAVLLPEADGPSARKVVDKVRDKMLKLNFRTHYPVTFSFGAASFRTAPDSVANMIFWADRTMYQAKQEGKDRVRHESFD